MPTRVVLDANALMLPFERRVRIEEELERLLGPFEALVPEAVLQELAKIAASSNGRRARTARSALGLANRFTYVASLGSGDAAVLDAARSLEAVLFSNDRQLLAKARSGGLRTVRLRSLTHLVLEP